MHSVYRPDDGDYKDLWNVGELLYNATTQKTVFTLRLKCHSNFDDGFLRNSVKILQDMASQTLKLYINMTLKCHVLIAYSLEWFVVYNFRPFVILEPNSAPRRANNKDRVVKNWFCRTVLFHDYIWRTW